MATKDDVEAYLLEMGTDYDELGDGVWMIHDEYDQIDNIIVLFSPPIITFRVKLMDVPTKNQREFFHTLLRLNATDLVHGAYGIDGDSVIIIDTLQSENLDPNEFISSVETLAFAISTHYEELKKFRD